MNSIVTKKIENTRYLLGSPDSAKGRYNQIKGTFPKGNEYRVFAEPIILEDGQSIVWTTEYKGVAINYEKLSQDEQKKAKKMLSKQIKTLFDASKTYQDSSLTEFLYQCIEIPDLNNIYVIRKGEEENIVLIEWGFVSDIPGAERGLLAKIINVKRVPMLFTVVYQDDDSIATGAEIHFEFEEEKEIHKSNEKGKIIVDEVKIDEIVTSYQLENNNKIGLQTHKCIEEGRYKIKVPRIIDMKFKVVNGKNEILPNETFIFNYNEQEVPLASDENGLIMLSKLHVDTEVKAFQMIEEQEAHVHRFICEKEKEEYLLVIKEDVFNMKFKVIDNKDNIIPNAEITVKYNNQTKTLFTDENGYAILEDVDPETKVEVVAKAKKQKSKSKS